MTDDCFAKFDEAFESLAAEFDTTTTGALVKPAAVSATLRIVPPPDSEGRTARPVQPQGRGLEEYAEAFDMLDAHLASHPAPASPGDELLANYAGKLTAPAPKPTLRAGDSTASGLVATSGSVALSTDIELWRRRAGGTPLERLMGTLQNLSLIQRRLNDRTARHSDRITTDDIAATFSDVRALCVEFDLPTARVRADFALAALESDQLEALSHEITELVRHVRHDLQSCSIVPIARDRVWSFSLALDERTAAAFPSAQDDFIEGGQCFGFGRYAASVFHMLRAAEHGIRALRVAASPKKTTDANVVLLLEARLAEADQWTPSAAKQRAQEFYEAALSQVRRLRDAERKLARGTSKAVLDESQAVAVYEATRELLTLLAGRISEAQARSLRKNDFCR